MMIKPNDSVQIVKNFITKKEGIPAETLVLQFDNNDIENLLKVKQGNTLEVRVNYAAAAVASKSKKEIFDQVAYLQL